MKRLIIFIAALFAVSNLTFGAGLTVSSTNGVSVNELVITPTLTNSTSKGTMNLAGVLNLTMPSLLAANAGRTNIFALNSNGVPVMIDFASLVGIAGGGTGDMLGSDNLSDVVDAGQSRTNIGANDASNLTTGTLPMARLGSAVVTNNGTLTGIIKGNGASGVGNAVGGTDYTLPSTTLTLNGTPGYISITGGSQDLSTSRTWLVGIGSNIETNNGSITGVTKGNGGSGLVAATPGTDYVVPATTLNITGASGQFNITGGAQDLSTSRTWNVALPSSLTPSAGATNFVLMKQDTSLTTLDLATLMALIGTGGGGGLSSPLTADLDFANHTATNVGKLTMDQWRFLTNTTDHSLHVSNSVTHLDALSILTNGTLRFNAQVVTNMWGTNVNGLLNVDPASSTNNYARFDGSGNLYGTIDGSFWTHLVATPSSTDTNIVAQNSSGVLIPISFNALMSAISSGTPFGLVTNGASQPITVTDGVGTTIVIRTNIITITGNGVTTTLTSNTVTSAQFVGNGGTLTNMTNSTTITGGTGISVTQGVNPNGSYNYNVSSTGGGGGGSAALAITNILVTNTTPILLDFSLVQSGTLQLLTNATLVFTNISALTNYHDESAMFHFWQDTNGTRQVSATVANGILRTNSNNWPGTNASEMDTMIVRYGPTGTNLLVECRTNWLPTLSYTNSLNTAGGGGGGGGAAWTLIDAQVINNASGSVTVNTVGANLVVYCGSGSGFSPVNNNQGDTYTEGNDIANSPRADIWYKISPVQTASYQFTAGSQGPVVILSFAKSAGTPVLDSQTAGLSSGSAFWHNNTTVQPGSITPATSADLMLSSVIYDTSSSTTAATVNSSYIIGATGQSTIPKTIRFSYKIKSDSTAENPGWLNSSGGDLGFMITHMAFK